MLENKVLLSLQLFSIISFLGYGVSCLVSARMVTEFERYKLARFRVVTGYLQCLGAAGLTAGLFYPIVGVIAAAGISLQMLLGVWTRRRIGDSWLLASPAATYCLMNAYIAATLLQLK